MFSLKFPRAVTYMLQASEYQVGPYLRWFWRTRDFSKVMHRRQLELTGVARAFVWFLSAGIALQLIVAVVVAVYGWSLGGSTPLYLLAFALVVTAQVTWAHLVLIPLVLARTLIIGPRTRRYRRVTKEILGNHGGVKIAVAGSYGKTTMKELLLTVLSEGKKVAATPANKNVAAAHYQFAIGLQGDEDVILVEFGEGKPGDVAAFTEVVRPSIGIITGLAPAHLDQYGTLEAAAKDIFSLADTLDAKNVYVNAESPETAPYIRPGFVRYGPHGVGEWKAEDIEVVIEGLRFSLRKGQRCVTVRTKLLGAHLVGTISAVVAVAESLGMTGEQIEAGLAKAAPYEHRMQPYRLGGAWIIDDAYNGNIEGVRAGTTLLGALLADRKIYVTPGLVDQGAATETVHREMGRLIASARPDIVVLMKNSVTDLIRTGLDEAGYQGEVRVESEPLRFYSHLDQLVAAGDVVMLQNDWTDNYN